MTSARPLVAVLLTVAVAALAVTAAEGKPRRPTPDLSTFPRLKAIPPALLAAFPVFRQPAVKKVPDLVLRSLQMPHSGKAIGADPRQARAITGLRGSPWYVIPGKKGLCLFVSGIWTCPKTADVVERGISFSTMPASTEPGEKPSAITYIGLMPASVTSLVLTQVSGETTTSPLGPTNAYRLDDIGPDTRVELTRDGAPPFVISGP